MTGTGLVPALEELGAALAALDLPLDLPDAGSARALRAELRGQLDDYVLPRLREIDAPLLAVVGGSTGAGKSTLVNSVVGRRVTEPGVLRPTTRSPVLVVNPADRPWFDGDRILPGFARTTGDTAGTGDARSLRLVEEPLLAPGLAVLDAPDIDSVETRNRELASQLLAAADLWLFVTSAARYADQVPWDFLRAAADRSAAVAVVLDRIPAGATAEVSAHLREMLDARGLEASLLFTVEEGPVDDAGLLAAAAVQPVRAWLDGLAQDTAARASVVRQTLEGAVRSLAERGADVAAAHESQVRVARRLDEEVDAAYAAAADEVARASADGSLLRGEVLARWQEFVGTGELLRSLESRVGWLRDRVSGWVRGRPPQTERVVEAVESGLEALLVEHAESAAERAYLVWEQSDAGRTLLSGADRDLGRASRGLRAQAERTVREWQQGVLELVRVEGADKRSTARFLAFGVNGLAVALMVVAFAHTGGLIAAEAGIAGGSAVVGQKLLEAVFGDQAVRRLAEQARTDLAARVEALYAGEAERFRAVLEGLSLDPTATERLRLASTAVTRASGELG